MTSRGAESTDLKFTWCQALPLVLGFLQMLYSFNSYNTPCWLGIPQMKKARHKKHTLY